MTWGLKGTIMNRADTSTRKTEPPQLKDCPVVILRDRFIFNTRTGAFFTISREGAFILDAAWRGMHRPEIEKTLMAAFSVPATTAMSDTARFLVRLEEMKLLPRHLTVKR